MRIRSLGATFFACAALASTFGFANAAEAVPGVSAREVQLGGTHPFSGPVSAYGVIDDGIQAYFAYVNSRGGVNGRKIRYEDLDDAYEPAQSLKRARQLVDRKRVFAMFNTLGTPSNLALRPYLNDKKVPQLFVSTGATTWGRNAAKYPWTIGFQVDYQAEAGVFGTYIAAHAPNAKIAILYQNDDFGRDYVTGLQYALGDKVRQIVGTAAYDVGARDVSAQISDLRRSGADTLVIAATPQFASQALAAVGQLSWKAATYLTSVSASRDVMRSVARQEGGSAATDGVVTANYLLDPTVAAYSGLRGMRLYRQLLSRYRPRADPSNIFVLYGMAVAYTMADTLARCGRDVTRERVMDAATHLNERDNPFLLPGISVQTSPDDHFPIRQEQLSRYANGNWQPFGLLIDARK